MGPPRHSQDHEQRQLYHLLNNLSIRVENRDELGTLVGYCVIESLQGFSPTTGSKEELRFQEIKAVHAGLEQTIDQLAIYAQRIPDYSFALMCDKIVATQPLFCSAQQGDADDENRRELLKAILASLPDKGYEDRLRRRGLELVESVRSRGSFRGAHDILTADYEDIDYCFALRGRKR